MNNPGHQNSPYGEDGETPARELRPLWPGILLALALIAVCAMAGCTAAPRLAVCERHDTATPGLLIVRDYGRGMVDGMQLPCMERVRVNGEGVEWVVHVMDRDGRLATMDRAGHTYHKEVGWVEEP